MADIELDKNKPHGEIRGPVKGAPKARYSQNGLYFNSEGKKVGGVFRPDPPPRVSAARGVVTTRVLGRQNRVVPSADTALAENRRALAVEEQAE